ncbi:MAG: chromate transporter, chromate ion transporter family [Bacteroidetes bacterium]|jgi:chromate transporter|nr:chromate transporter, chromate ion transporter family [Bacteroidota bacterium]
MRKKELKELALLFTKLGFIAFGGPAAHIAMMREEVVRRRKWMSEQHFLDLIGATNLIPGPNSTEMAMHIGRGRAGWKGLVLAGLCFILPAVFLTLLLAGLYKSYGQLPQVQPFLTGIKPAIIAVVLAAVFPLAKTALKNTWLLLTGIAVLILSLAGINEVLLLFSAGLLALGPAYIRGRGKDSSLNSFAPAGLLLAPTPLLALSNAKLFFIFLKTGALLYGSGYVLFAFLDAELVSTGLISRQQLTDAIAAGQCTPGPVFSAVTFIGYQVNGWSGAAVSTIGIFLPSFAFVALLNPLVEKMRNSLLFSAFLDAVNVASVAVIVAVCYQMGKESIADWRTALIAITGIVFVFVFKKVNSVFIVAGGALLGYVLSLI